MVWCARPTDSLILHPCLAAALMTLQAPFLHPAPLGCHAWTSPTICYTHHCAAGVMQPAVQSDGQVCVDMGPPILEPSKVPTTLPATQARPPGTPRQSLTGTGRRRGSPGVQQQQQHSS